MKQDQGAAPAGGNRHHRGTHHLRVGLEIGGGGLRVDSVWVVEQPAVQRPRLVESVLARVEVGGKPVLVEAFADPRVSRGMYVQGRGHSYGVAEKGLVFVSVPFTDLAELSDLRITVVDAAGAEARPAEPASALGVIEEGGGGVKVLGEVDEGDLQAHGDWAKVADSLGIAAETGRFEVYVDRAGEYRWRLRRPGGAIVADSGEGYGSREACESDLRWVRGNAAGANVAALDTPGSTAPG